MLNTGVFSRLMTVCWILSPSLILVLLCSQTDVFIAMELMGTCAEKLKKRIQGPIPEYILGKMTVAVSLQHVPFPFFLVLRFIEIKSGNNWEINELKTCSELFGVGGGGWGGQLHQR